MGKPGKREFVQVLRLMETFAIDDVAAAVRDAIQRGAVGVDAVKHLVLCRIERRPPRLDMAVYPVSAEGNRRDDVGPRLHGTTRGSGVMSDTPQVLLAHHLKALKLPTFLREYDKIAAPVRGRGRRLSTLPAAACRGRDHRARAAHGRSPDQGGQVPDREEPRQLRLRGVPGPEQGAGDGTGAVGIRRPPREHHRGRQLRHRQEPHRLGARPRRLPEGPVGRLRQRRSDGARVDRGSRREAAAAPSAPAGQPTSC